MKATQMKSKRLNHAAKFLVPLAIAVMFLFSLFAHTNAQTSDSSTDRGLATLKVYNVAMSVPNIDETVEWYEDKLGFRLEERRRRLASTGADVAIIEKNGFRIEFLQVPNSTRLDALHADPPAHLNTLGVKNLVFLVDDLAATNAELKSKGVNVIWESRVFPEIGATTTFFRDNNDNLVVIWQNPNSTN